MRPSSPPFESPPPRWFDAVKPARAVALVLHGLNMQPSRMDGLAEWLSTHGVEVCRAVLTGHDGNMDALKRATRHDYLRDTLGAYQAARQRADTTFVPLHVVGFSIGALMALDLAHAHPQTRFDKAVLFAPAIVPRAYTRAVRALSFLPHLVLGSLSRRDFRVHDGTPIAAYNALFASVTAVDLSRYERANIPTLVFVDPKDALVSLRGIERLIRKRKLDRWRVVPVTTDQGQLNATYHHLITEPDTLGETQWAAVTAAMRHHLSL